MQKVNFIYPFLLLFLTSCANINSINEYDNKNIHYVQAHNKDTKCLVFANRSLLLDKAIDVKWHGSCEHGFASGTNIIELKTDKEDIIGIQEYLDYKASLLFSYDKNKDIVFLGYDNYKDKRYGRIIYLDKNKQVASFYVYDNMNNKYIDYKKENNEILHLARHFRDGSKISIYTHKYSNNIKKDIFLYNDEDVITHKIVKEKGLLYAYIKDFGILNDKERVSLMYDNYLNVEQDISANFDNKEFTTLINRAKSIYEEKVAKGEIINVLDK